MPRKTKDFKIDPRYDAAAPHNRDRWMREKEPFTVRARSIESAAAIGARRIWGKKNVGAHRATGDFGKSGCFQMADSAPGGGINLSSHYFNVW